MSESEIKKNRDYDIVLAATNLNVDNVVVVNPIFGVEDIKKISKFLKRKIHLNRQSL